MAKRKSQSDHDEMVRKVANTLLDTQFTNVRADIPDYERPAIIEWTNNNKRYIPDVTGFKNHQTIIEIETDDSIEDEHTKDQWAVFSAYCLREKADFLIVVPTRSKDKAEKRKKALNIEGDVLEINIQ